MLQSMSDNTRMTSSSFDSDSTQQSGAADDALYGGQHATQQQAAKNVVTSLLGRWITKRLKQTQKLYVDWTFFMSVSFNLFLNTFEHKLCSPFFRHAPVARPINTMRKVFFPNFPRLLIVSKVLNF